MGKRAKAQERQARCNAIETACVSAEAKGVAKQVPQHVKRKPVSQDVQGRKVVKRKPGWATNVGTSDAPSMSAAQVASPPVVSRSFVLSKNFEFSEVADDSMQADLERLAHSD